MPAPHPARAPHGEEPDPTALSSLFDSVDARVGSLAQRLSRTFRDEVLEYRAFTETTVERDVVPLAEDKLREMLTALRTGAPPSAQDLHINAAAAARRFHQGVPLPALLHAYRVRERTIWAELVDVADLSDPDQLRALIVVASRVMEHIDAISGTVERSYLNEQSGLRRDPAVLRGDVLEALLDSRIAPGPSAGLRETLNAHGFPVDELSYAVLTFRTRAHTADLSAVQELTRGHLLRPAASGRNARRGVMGVRHDEVVWLLEEDGADEALSAVADAVDADPGLVAGVGSGGTGLRHAALSYLQARAASDIALAAGGPSVRTHRDVLLDLALTRGAEEAGLVESTLEPLLHYDREHGTELVLTLQAYVAHRFHAAGAATVLHVRPNTVLYRLERIGRITGHDPMAADGILALSLGIRALRRRPAAWSDRTPLDETSTARPEG